MKYGGRGSKKGINNRTIGKDDKWQIILFRYNT